ncbi:hypothetical protein O6H91_01G071900 [Diphasiastrum complanatum]|uniref:Uncharacterized protein n=1 Tax=Diphasiastrum complanatum TaxID=34168 RepID=A0ACC2ES55_DIPCM|nr:hypothetical protein O6H91_01G071900 [Diphasiastrum complanatum]
MRRFDVLSFDVIFYCFTSCVDDFSKLLYYLILQISSNDQTSDSISFDFAGNYPNRISTNYAVNGNSGGHQEIYVVSFDTSVKFHTYTIKWDSDSIMWLVDNVLLRTVVRSNGEAYPVKPGSVYGFVWDASYVANGGYAGIINWSFGPFFVYYDSLVATSPIAPGTWKPPALITTVSEVVPVPMRPLAIDYCGSNIFVTETDTIVTYDRAGCGGRFRSIARYPSGTFTSKVKCAAGDTSGLLTSIYLSSLEGSPIQDEIDFEWLGNKKTVVQTNFYVTGTGGHEVIIDLGFDCSQSYHTYTIAFNNQRTQ